MRKRSKAETVTLPEFVPAIVAIGAAITVALVVAPTYQDVRVNVLVQLCIAASGAIIQVVAHRLPAGKTARNWDLLGKILVAGAALVAFAYQALLPLLR